MMSNLFRLLRSDCCHFVLLNFTAMIFTTLDKMIIDQDPGNDDGDTDGDDDSAEDDFSQDNDQMMSIYHSSIFLLHTYK